MSSRPTCSVAHWSGWRAPRTCARSWWVSTPWWRWTGRRAPPRCSDPTHWPTASETSTARKGRSVHTRADMFAHTDAQIEWRGEKSVSFFCHATCWMKSLSQAVQCPHCPTISYSHSDRYWRLVTDLCITSTHTKQPLGSGRDTHDEADSNECDTFS